MADDTLDIPTSTEPATIEPEVTVPIAEPVNSAPVETTVEPTIQEPEPEVQVKPVEPKVDPEPIVQEPKVPETKTPIPEVIPQPELSKTQTSPTQEKPPEKVEVKEEPKKPSPPSQPTVSDTDLEKRVDQKVKETLKLEQTQRRQLANMVRKQRKENNLREILEFVQKHSEVTNQQVRDLLQVSQSTATNYLTQLAKSGKLKQEGSRGFTKYRI